MIRVKICCISSREEARMAIEAGAAALGLVGEMPSGPGILEDSQIADITLQIPPPIASFLLTSRTTAENIIEHAQLTRTNTLQLVDAVPMETYDQIRKALPGIKLVQVLHVLDEDNIKEAIEIAPHVDALLLDSGNPNKAVKELGGTGRTHDWSISRRIVEAVKIPVFLAGGLNPKNVATAIQQVQPFGLDICSGVRTAGKLDPEKLAAFFKEVQANS